MPLSAELILWMTSHLEQHGTKKWGSVHLDPHTARKWGAQDPTGSPPLLVVGAWRYTAWKSVCHAVFAVVDDKKKKGKRIKGHKVASLLYFINVGRRHHWTPQNWQFVGVDDVIVQSKVINFLFQHFRGFRSAGFQNFHVPIDFADHRYNSATAIAQLVIF